MVRGLAVDLAYRTKDEKQDRDEAPVISSWVTALVPVFVGEWDVENVW